MSTRNGDGLLISDVTKSITFWGSLKLMAFSDKMMEFSVEVSAGMVVSSGRMTVIPLLNCPDDEIARSTDGIDSLGLNENEEVRLLGFLHSPGSTTSSVVDTNSGFGVVEKIKKSGVYGSLVLEIDSGTKGSLIPDEKCSTETPTSLGLRKSWSFDLK